MGKLPVFRWPEDASITQQTVAEAWAQDGFDCALWIDPPGQAWLGFVPPTDERVVVRQGTLEFHVEGGRAMLEPGDEVFIPADKRHSVWNRGDTIARWFYGYRRKW